MPQLQVRTRELAGVARALDGLGELVGSLRLHECPDYGRADVADAARLFLSAADRWLEAVRTDLALAADDLREAAVRYTAADRLHR